MCNVIVGITVCQKFRRKLLVRISLLSPSVFIRCICSSELTTK